MKRVLVWDLPVRMFHWLLAGGVVLAFLIAYFTDDDGSVFPYHAMIGIVLGVLLLLRLIWGFFGTRYARFNSFLFGPRAVGQYLKGVLTGRGIRHIGHNPASSWIIFLIFACVAVVVASGLLMSQAKAFEEIHELSVYTLLALVGIHVTGVLLHTVRHRENITLAMITGRKAAEEQAAIRSAAPVPAMFFLAILIALGVALLRNYDPSTRTTKIPFLASRIQLTESEHHEANDHSTGRPSHEEVDD